MWCESHPSSTVICYCRQYVLVEQRVHMIGPSYDGHMDMMMIMMM